MSLVTSADELRAVIGSETPALEWEGEACSSAGLDPVWLERIWDGSARIVALRWGVSERTVVRWRNGHAKPWEQYRASVDWSALARRGWETRRRHAVENVAAAPVDSRDSAPHPT